MTAAVLLLHLLLLLLRLCLSLRRKLPLRMTLFLFFPPLLLVIPLLLLDGVESNGPWNPSLNLRGLNPLIRGTRLIANSDGVAHSPLLGRLRGSLLTMRTRRLAPSGGQQDDSGAIAPLRLSMRGLIVASRWSRVRGTWTRPKATRQS